MKFARFAVVIPLHLAACAGADEVSASDVETLQARLDAIEARVDPSAGGVDVGALLTRVDDLESDLTACEGSVTAVATDVTAVEASLLALQTDLGDAQVDIGVAQDDLDALYMTLNDLDSRIDTLEDAPSGGALVVDGAQVFSGVPPTSFTELDLSAHVGTGASVAILRVDLSADLGDGNYLFVPKGQAATLENNSFGTSQARVRTTGSSYAVVITDASGKLDWTTSFSGTNEATVTLVAHIK